MVAGPIFFLTGLSGDPQQARARAGLEQDVNKVVDDIEALEAMLDRD